MAARQLVIRSNGVGLGTEVLYDGVMLHGVTGVTFKVRGDELATAVVEFDLAGLDVTLPDELLDRVTVCTGGVHPGEEPTVTVHAPDGVDLDDPVLWRAANPGLPGQSTP